MQAMLGTHLFAGIAENMQAIYGLDLFAGIAAKKTFIISLLQAEW